MLDDTTTKTSPDMNKPLRQVDFTPDEDDGPLYAAGKKIYQQSVTGPFRRTDRKSVV